MNNDKHRPTGIVIHILVWIGVFSMPYLLAFFTDSERMPFDAGTFTIPLQAVFIFYINYLWLINKFLFKKRVWLFLGINLLITTASTVVFLYIRYIFIPPANFPVRPQFGDRPTPFFPVIMSSISQFLVVGLSVAIKMTNKWFEARQRVQELEKANAEAELQQLKSQLNPHFLFNSLNNIYALISLDAEKAQVTLHSLCDMLRYQLYEANRETITLEKEIEFVRSYCELTSLRLPKHVTLNLDLPGDTGRLNIAPLLFVSIIENAFKHGVSQSEPSYISIKISKEKESVVCTVRNSCYPKKDNDRSGSGIGLDNLRRRMELLYPDSYSFRTEKIGSEFIAQLTIKTIL